jgi:hypothetical protein
MIRLTESIHYKKGLTKITHLEIFSFPSVKLAGYEYDGFLDFLNSIVFISLNDNL